MDARRAAETYRPLMQAREVNAFLREVFPQACGGEPPDYRALDIWPGGCHVRLEAGFQHLRPGDTVSGPSLFALADIGGYVCALSHIGPEALAVTTNLNINFMRKATAGPVDGHCRILKLGRRLMVFEAELFSGEKQATVAHATGTYSLPPTGGA
ncbi:PaaI family thioesterase [Nitratireductor pacificus]|uniref:Thioesterase superfamily protein n=1 Tax=Nitratireductor pacificus pht-3B TaxID=391937 RepID=K2MSA3_9HYPH|nr:PaaI family thioesterase [Nitratireductor pacificus]EKF20232.1 thioesterase superfamily protein [Nitratireductor pacificus pht-3B]